jgi:DNA-binding winged helix-turn-helix (wHTH) protein
MKCHWLGANIGINDAISDIQFQYIKTFERKGYSLGGEVYSGWLTHWGEKWQTKPIEKNEQ